MGLNSISSTVYMAVCVGHLQVYRVIILSFVRFAFEKAADMSNTIS